MSAPKTLVKPPLTAPAEEDPVPAPPQSLGATLRADFDALQNDFEQASEMAADLQRQLSGKSNEFADLKYLFDKTSSDFGRVQQDLASLREERHQLANEAMKVTALEFQLNDLMAEKERLKKELFTLRASPAQVPNHCGNPEHKKQITALSLELNELRAQPKGGGLDAATLDLIQKMADSVKRIEAGLGQSTGRHNRVSAAPSASPESEVIQIEFSP